MNNRIKTVLLISFFSSFTLLAIFNPPSIFSQVNCLKIGIKLHDASNTWYCDAVDNNDRPDKGEATYFYCLKDEKDQPCCVGPTQDAQIACQQYVPTPTPTPTLTRRPTSPPAATPTPRTFTPYEAPSNSFFDMLNPLKHAGGDDIFEDEASAYADQLSTPGGIVSRLLAFAFPLAGLILFVMLVWGGFEILIQAPSKKGIDAGKQRVTAAIIGFILLFSSYWIWQIVEVVFGIVIF
jgi:hypothetical protein